MRNDPNRLIPFIFLGKLRIHGLRRVVCKYTDVIYLDTPIYPKRYMAIADQRRVIVCQKWLKDEAVRRKIAP